MPDTTEFLSGQLAAYVESWKVDHRDAIECWELESRIEVAMALFHCIRTADEHWSESVRGGSSSAGGSEGKEIGALYRRWLAASSEVEKSASRLETTGFSIEHAARFRAARKDVRIVLSTNVADIEAAFDQLDRGEIVPLGEVADEIRRRHVKKGA